MTPSVDKPIPMAVEFVEIPMPCLVEMMTRSTMGEMHLRLATARLRMLGAKQIGAHR